MAQPLTVTRQKSNMNRVLLIGAYPPQMQPRTTKPKATKASDATEPIRVQGHSYKCISVTQVIAITYYLPTAKH